MILHRAHIIGAHIIASGIGGCCIAVFLISSVFSEIFLSYEAIIAVKYAVVFPGLVILVPAIMATGITGKLLKKELQMRFIALNGMLFIVPLAFILRYRAGVYMFDETFYTLQAIELVAGAINLFLMSLNLMSLNVRQAHIRY